MKARLLAVSAIALLPIAADVRAEDCSLPRGAGALPGTLAGAAPCVPVAKPRKKEPAKSTEKAKAPGTFRSGNTTIHVGGSVQSDVSVRGR